MCFTCVFIVFMKIKLVLTRSLIHEDPFWNRGRRQLGDGLLRAFAWETVNMSLDSSTIWELASSIFYSCRYLTDLNDIIVDSNNRGVQRTLVDGAPLTGYKAELKSMLLAVNHVTRKFLSWFWSTIHEDISVCLSEKSSKWKENLKQFSSN